MFGGVSGLGDVGFRGSGLRLYTLSPSSDPPGRPSPPPLP